MEIAAVELNDRPLVRLGRGHGARTIRPAYIWHFNFGFLTTPETGYRCVPFVMG